MIDTAWLVYRLHRFEVALAVFLFLLLGVSAVAVTSHLRATQGVPEACWESAAGPDPDPVCQTLVDASRGAGDEATLVIQAMAIVPSAVGILLGVPLLAQEIELRTTSLAWSLSPSRRRWLFRWLLPMVLLAVLALAMVGLETSWLADALEETDHGRSLDDIGSYGLVMVTRGLLALGVGLLVGAVVGRSLPAFLTAAVVMLAWGVAGAPLLRDAVMPGQLVWMTYEERDRNGVVAIAYEHSQDGGSTYQAADGRILTYRDVQTERCGVDLWADDISAEGQQCLDEMDAPGDSYREIAHLVPRSALEHFQIIEAVVGASLGAVAILLTFPVVMRRRPA